MGFGLYFALTWLIVLTLCMKPERVDVGLLLGVAASTAIVGVVAAFLVEQIPAVKWLFDKAEGTFVLARCAGFVLGAGLVEEAAKALAIYVFFYRRARDYRPLTYAYVGVVSGLAFGVVEAVGYSYAYATREAWMARKGSDCSLPFSSCD